MQLNLLIKKIVAKSLSSLPALSTQKSKRQPCQPADEPNEAPANLNWAPSEEDFLWLWNMMVKEFALLSHLMMLAIPSKIITLIQSTQAKDDKGNSYWIYNSEENIETYEDKNVLQVQPSIILAKNIKRRDPVFALLNREVIEAIASPLFK